MPFRRDPITLVLNYLKTPSWFRSLQHKVKALAAQAIPQSSADRESVTEELLLLY